MINRLRFSIDIKADKAQIWKALWNDNFYRDWISAFGEGSYAVTNNWKVGSKVLFLGPNGSGIYSVIETHTPNEKIGFKHIGNVLNGKEQPLDDKTRLWSGTTEVYSITENDEDHNTLTVEIDVLDEHLEFMTAQFPKALEIVKHNCG